MARCKGTNLIGLVKFLREHRDRALEVLPPAAHRYLDDRVLPSSWYPVQVHRDLLRAVRALMPRGGEPYVEMGRASARADLGGIYRAHLRPADPLGSLKSLRALWRNYQDSGELSAEVESQTSVVVVLRNYPSFREFCDVTGGYVAELVAMTGARDVTVRELQCCVDGAADCRWRIRWQPVR